MSRKAKKKAKIPRKKRRSSFTENLTGISIKVLSIIGLSALALTILFFILSTISVWVFEENRDGDVTPPDVSLEVLNGCGMEGAAKELTSILRKKGYKVADFRNAEHFSYEHTTIKVRNAALEDGELVSSILGCDRVVYEPSEDALADISVVIGPDWEELKVVTGEEDTGDRIKSFLDFFRDFSYFR